MKSRFLPVLFSCFIAEQMFLRCPRPILLRAPLPMFPNVTFVFFFLFCYGYLTHINSFYALNFRVSLLHHIFFKTQPFICLFFSTCFRKRSIQRTKPEQKSWVEFNTIVSPAPTPSSSSDASQDQRSRSGPQVGYTAMLIHEESFVRCC